MAPQTQMTFGVFKELLGKSNKSGEGGEKEGRREEQSKR